MTINEAIVHERQCEKNCIKQSELYDGFDRQRYITYAENHRQIAEWLEELKAYKGSNFEKVRKGDKDEHRRIE